MKKLALVLLTSSMLSSGCSDMFMKTPAPIVPSDAPAAINDSTVAVGDAAVPVVAHQATDIFTSCDLAGAVAAHNYAAASARDTADDVACSSEIRRFQSQIQNSRPKF